MVLTTRALACFTVAFQPDAALCVVHVWVVDGVVLLAMTNHMEKQGIQIKWCNFGYEWHQPTTWIHRLRLSPQIGLVVVMFE